MSAGTGISHSEYNASQTEPVHFLQIWIVPNKTGLAPAYEQRAFPLDEHRNKWTLIGSEAGRDGSVTVHQDVDVWVARFASGAQATFRLKPSRYAFAHVARGAVTFNGTTLNAGHGATVSEEEFLRGSLASSATSYIPILLQPLFSKHTGQRPLCLFLPPISFWAHNDDTSSSAGKPVTCRSAHHSQSESRTTCNIAYSQRFYVFLLRRPGWHKPCL